MRRFNIILALVAAAVVATLYLDLPPQNPYKFLYESDGIAYYSYCTETNCTVLPESEVPEKFRKVP